MKKRVAAPILAVVLAIGGWFFGFNNESTDSSKGFITASNPQQILDVNKEGLAPNKYINAYVVKVTDGDTLEVTYKGETQKVRLLCVDTPESVKQGVDAQPYSKEASEFTKKLALNQPAKLVFDKGLRDRYGRLLAYVILKEDVFLNAVLVRNGYARVEIVSPNSTLKDYFNELQEKAIQEKVGFWGVKKEKQPFQMDKSGKYVPKYKLEEAS